LTKPVRNDSLIEAIKLSLAGVETGVATSEGDIFNDTLPEGVTTEHVEKLNTHITDFTAAAAEATGLAFVDALKKDAKLEGVVAKIPYGAFGEASFKVVAQQEVTVPGTSDKTTSYGNVLPKLDFVAGRNAGQLAKAKQSVKALVQAELKKLD